MAKPLPFGKTFGFSWLNLYLSKKLIFFLAKFSPFSEAPLLCN